MGNNSAFSHVGSILKTKLHMPGLRPNLVTRKRILDKLNSGIGMGCRVTLISAGAGYGKTTLAVEWLKSTKRPVAWISLDEFDNDPVRLLSYLTACMDMIFPDFMHSMGSLINPAGMPPASTLAAALSNEISSLDTPFILVLDDYHVISNTYIHDFLQCLIDYQPQVMHILLITRHDPPLPLARLRVKAQLNEIRAEDLRFTPKETEEFFSRTMGVKLKKEILESLGSRTEGWAAGLQLAGLSIQGWDEVRIENFVEDFSGSSRHVIDYLFEEVLERQEDNIRDFMCSTSVLQRFNASLCQAVTGSEDSGTVLERLSKANLFIIPLDTKGEWYRYHHLFSDFLQTELKGQDRAFLHRKASSWFKDNNLPEEAVSHALSAGDYMEAESLMEAYAPGIIQKGEVKTFMGWIEALPKDRQWDNIGLGVFKAWCLFLVGRMAEAKPIMDILEKGIGENPVYEGGLKALKTLFPYQSIEERVKDAVDAVELIGDKNLFFKSAALLSLGQIQAGTGENEKAVESFHEAYTCAYMTENHFTAVTAAANWAINLNWLGRREEALLVCRQALEGYTDSMGRLLPMAQMVHIPLGMLCYYGSELEKAEEYLKSGIGFCRKLFLVHTMGIGEWFLSLTEYALGNIDEAFEVIRETRNIVNSVNQKGISMFMDIAEAGLNLMEGRLEQAFSWAKDVQYSPMDMLNVGKIMELTVYVRTLIAMGNLEEAGHIINNLEKALGGKKGHLINIYILHSLLGSISHSDNEALKYLEEALSMAAPEGYLRPFVDMGAGVYKMLHKVVNVNPGFVRRILDAANTVHNKGDNIPQTAREGYVEALSERELEILRLAAEGLSNDEIASRLYITLGTAKWHMNNIFGKLGVNKRTLAIDRARKLKLID